MLSVENLHLHLHGQIILDRVSIALTKGQTLCVVGESGSGKTSLLRALQGLMPARFDCLVSRPGNGQDVHFEHKWHGPPGLPGSRWVMQDPIAALNPKLRLGTSIAESLHGEKHFREDIDRAVASALRDVELPEGIAGRRPAEVSLGQAQRACLARALIARPDLIFFDEPLSALDAVIQKQIAATMKRIQLRYGITYVIVTHDLGFAEAYADHILVLRQGRVEANQPAVDFFQEPESDYCQALMEAARDLGGLSSSIAPSPDSMETAP